MGVNGEFASRADLLFHEFHDRVIKDFASTIRLDTENFVEREDSIGLFAREAIYYGAEGFYIHQFLNFSHKRYKDDEEWLLQNVGLSVEHMLNIARFILDHINTNITKLVHLRERGHQFSNADLTTSLLIAKEDLRKQFGAKCDVFFVKFVSPIVGINKVFTDPFSVNAVSLAPIIELDDYLYVPVQYRLFESIYESLFF